MQVIVNEQVKLNKRVISQKCADDDCQNYQKNPRLSKLYSYPKSALFIET